MRGGGIRELSVLSAQFSCQPSTALGNKVHNIRIFNDSRWGDPWIRDQRPRDPCSKDPPRNPGRLSPSCPVRNSNTANRRRLPWACLRPVGPAAPGRTPCLPSLLPHLAASRAPAQCTCFENQAWLGQAPFRIARVVLPERGLSDHLVRIRVEGGGGRVEVRLGAPASRSSGLTLTSSAKPPFWRFWTFPPSSPFWKLSPPEEISPILKST